MRPEPVWVRNDVVGQIHGYQIAQFGGRPGIRDEGMLESALARPHNLWLYERVSITRLAAAHAFGIAMNHPFIDGNKRTAFVVSVLFLELNGFPFNAEEVDAASMFVSLAAGELDEAELSDWFEQWAAPVS
jgi:death-on-curing protein